MVGSTFVGEVAHIYAISPGGPRYSKDKTRKELNDISNLMLLCPIHHKIVDKEVIKYPAGKLQEIKKNREQNPPVIGKNLLDWLVQTLEKEKNNNLKKDKEMMDRISEERLENIKDNKTGVLFDTKKAFLLIHCIPQEFLGKSSEYLQRKNCIDEGSVDKNKIPRPIHRCFTQDKCTEGLANMSESLGREEIVSYSLVNFEGWVEFADTTLFKQDGETVSPDQGGKRSTKYIISDFPSKVTQAVESAVLFLKEQGLEGPYYVHVTVRNIRGYMTTHPRNGGKPINEDQFSHSGWLENPDGVRDGLDSFFEKIIRASTSARSPRSDSLELFRRVGILPES